LKKQNDIIETAISTDIKEISKQVETYPKYKPYEDKSEAIYEDKKVIEKALQGLVDNLTFSFLAKAPKQKWNEGEVDKFKFWSRIQAVHYRVPKKILFKQEQLVEVFEVINQQQDSLLLRIASDSLKSVLKEKHFINTAEMYDKFKKVPFAKALVLLQSMKNQTASTAKFMVAHQLKIMQDEVNTGLLKVNDFAIMNSMRKSVYEIEETVECDIFTMVYYDSDDLLVEVNGVEKQMKNGIADFTFTPTSPGTKKLNVTITNPKAENEYWRTYRKEFEYYVIE